MFTLTAAFLNFGIFECYFSKNRQFIFSGWDKYPWFWRVYYYEERRSVCVPIASISSVILTLMNTLKSLSPTLPIQLMMSKCVALPHTNISRLSNQWIICNNSVDSSHWLLMVENCNYLAGPSSTHEGNKRNLYGSLMSTEHRCCHLIRDLIVIIMNKYTQHRLKRSCKHSAN